MPSPRTSGESMLPDDAKLHPGETPTQAGTRFCLRPRDVRAFLHCRLAASTTVITAGRGHNHPGRHGRDALTILFLRVTSVTEPRACFTPGPRRWSRSLRQCELRDRSRSSVLKRMRCGIRFGANLHRCREALVRLVTRPACSRCCVRTSVLDATFACCRNCLALPAAWFWLLRWRESAASAGGASGSGGRSPPYSWRRPPVTTCVLCSGHLRGNFE